MSISIVKCKLDNELKTNQNVNIFVNWLMTYITFNFINLGILDI